MEIWQISYDPATRGHEHVTEGGRGHSLLAALAATVLGDLGVSAAVWEHGQEWMTLHVEPRLFHREFELGGDVGRAQYNASMLDRAKRERRPVIGKYAGYEDVFAPVTMESKLVAVLVAGPFWRAPLTANQIRQAWLSLSGREALPSDPDLAIYVSAALSTLLLDEKQVRQFQDLVAAVARLLGGEGAADAGMNQVETLRVSVGQARFPERAWDLMRRVVEQGSGRNPHSGALGNDLRDLGLTRLSDHVAVALTSARASGDLVDEAVRCHLFQRRAAELARATGHALAGRVRDHGIVLLSGTSGSVAHRRQKLVELAEAVTSAGRKLGLDVHFGVCPINRSRPIGPGYQAALGAASAALANGQRLVFAHERPGPADSLLGLRHRLRHSVTSDRPEFVALLDRYLEAAGNRLAYRVEPLAAHLDVAFEDVLEPLVGAGLLDERGLREVTESWRRQAARATTASEVLDLYRTAVSRVVQSAERPVPARQDRNLQMAIDYIHEHYAEPLRRNAVARIAGFAPAYFSELFRKREHVTFEQYVSGLRIERAKQLLDGTDLSVSRITQLCGFKTPEYFARAFRRASGSSPLRYRAALRKGPSAPGSPSHVRD